MTDKDIKDYCKSCDVEPPAMKFKCPVCKHNPDKEIIIDGVDVSGCKHYKINGKCRIPHYQQGIKYENCNCNEWDCYFKQLQKEKFENLNNRQMVESAENLIYENSELIKNLKEKEQECETLASQLDFEVQKKECLEQECEELKKKCNIYTCGICGNKEDCNKLYKTLTEIKEIIQSDYCTEIGSCEFCAEVGNCLNRKILQKISEYEVLND